MNNVEFDKINCTLIKESVSNMITTLRKVETSSVDTKVNNTSIWEANSKKKLYNSLVENKSEVSLLINKLELFLTVIDKIDNIKKLEEQKNTSGISQEDINNKANQLFNEIKGQLNTI